MAARKKKTPQTVEPTQGEEARCRAIRGQVTLLNNIIETFPMPIDIAKGALHVVAGAWFLDPRGVEAEVEAFLQALRDR